MKTTKQYIKEFNLDSPNFSREKFIAAFGDEFRERYMLTRETRAKMGLDTPFEIFSHLIKEMQDKFWSISGHKQGEPFNAKLFSAFYAVIVLPLRAEYYPEKDAEIKARREDYLIKQREKGLE